MKLYYDAQKVEMINGNVVVTPYVFHVNHDKIRYIIQNDTIFVLANDITRLSGYRNFRAATLHATKNDATRLKVRTRYSNCGNRQTNILSISIYVQQSAAELLYSDPSELIANNSGYVYILEAERANGEKIIKIGSTKNYKKRHKSLMRYCYQAGLKQKRFYVTKKRAQYTDTEFAMHKKFKKHRYPRSEWFDADFDSAKAELIRMTEHASNKTRSAMKYDIHTLFDELWLDYRSKSEPNHHIVLDTADTVSARLLEALSDKRNADGFIVLDFVDEEATKRAMQNRKD